MQILIRFFDWIPSVRFVPIVATGARMCLAAFVSVICSSPSMAQVMCGTNESTLATSSIEPAGFGCAIQGDGSVINMLVVYTPAAKVAAELRTGDDIVTVITDHVAFTNVALADSLIDTQWNLVGIQEVAYVESGCQFTDKARLDDPGDGFMDEVQTVADQLNADVIGLMVESCGSAIPPCATGICGVGGGGSFLWAGDITNDGLFAHESGHVLGGAHCQSYTYGQCVTIMGIAQSDSCRGGEPLPDFGDGCSSTHYSNPDVIDRGHATGDATHNNAAIMNGNRVAVANLRNPPDCNCNGIADADDLAAGTSSDTNGNGQPDECDCTVDSDCDDGLFCAGPGVCDLQTSTCQHGPLPCVAAAPCTILCDEATDQCNVPDDSFCDDGVFCNGAETCDPVLNCQPGVAPCQPGEACDENLDACIVPVCGNLECEAGEDCNSCPQDCVALSLAICGDGICNAADGEDCMTCSEDCNKFTGGGAVRCCGEGGSCSQDPLCTVCVPPGCSGNFCVTQPANDSCCGDGFCEGREDNTNCARDCS